MTKRITIIMPYLNEQKEPLETVQSIYDTAPSDLFEILAIDDGSKGSPLDFSKFKGVKMIKCKERKGVDGCRHLGVKLANTPYVFIIDAHMRFKNDQWAQKVIEGLEREPKTAWCTTCVALGYGSNDINKAASKYYGATMSFVNPDVKPDRPARDVLEPKWAAKRSEAEYEIPCILGANYAFSKEWFDHIRGLKGLKLWGTSEPFLSLKSWMAGGKCKIRTDVEIGHVFRKNAPYVTRISSLVYNKIYLCKTILPQDLGETLMRHLPQDKNFREAMSMIEDNVSEIQSDKDYYSHIFKRSVYDYCDKFQIDLPPTKGDCSNRKE